MSGAIMRVLRVLRQRVRSIVRGAKADAELARELEFHLEQLTRENIAGGMKPAEARLAARRTLGGLAQIEEQCRDHRRVGSLIDLLKDFNYAVRMLAKSSGFTALAVVTLALGVGASIAVYALSEALLLRSFPYREPERLVRLTDVHARQGESGAGQQNFRDWQASNTVFERMALTDFSQATLTGNGEAERIQGLSVSEGFFELLGVQPQLGRWLRPDEYKPGAPCAVMLSHGFWARKLGARSDAVGGDLIMNDRTCRIAGVMPQSFRFNEGGVAEYWSPIGYVSDNRKQHQYGAYARLRPGVSVKTAQAQMREIAGRLAQAYPEDAGWSVRVRSLRSEMLDTVGSGLLILGAAALIVLLVGCANVASLMLARGIGRSREIAVRVALGAGRARVVRLLLAETLLVSGMSAVLGGFFAAWLLRLAISAAPPWMQLADAVSVSAWTVVFSVGLALCTGLLAGLWPALRGSRTDLENELKESGGALVAGKRQTRSLNALVATEVALSVVLLTFAGLLVKSFTQLLHTSLGYSTDHILTFRMPLPDARYRAAAARIQFWDDLLARLAGVPGVLSAAASDSIPLGGTFSGAPVEVEGQAMGRDWADVTTRGAVVTPDYFRTMGIAVRAGRTFIPGDAGAEPVVVVNEAFVRKLLPGRAPLGVRVRTGRGPWVRIIGVIGDGRYSGPMRKADAEAYLLYTQAPYLQFVSIHTAGPEQGVLAAARRIIRQLDPGLPITQVRTMRQSVDLSISLERQMMTLVAGFGAITLAMAAMGLSGVMLYTVSRRRREIGLRIALGASPRDISRGVLGAAAWLVASGSAIGVLAALASSRILQSSLYGVRWYDPIALAAAPAVLAAIALAACLLPSRRAARVEPMQALRQE